VLLLALLLAATGAAEPAPRDAEAYLALGASYRQTGSATAVDAIRAWTTAEVSGAQRRLRSREGQLRDRASGPDEVGLRFVEWTALLHLEAGLRAMQETNDAEGAQQLAAGAALVRWTTEAAASRAKDPALPAEQRLHPRVALEAFHAAAAGAALAVGFPAIAEAHGEEARDAAPANASALLALAAARDGLAHLQLVEGRTGEARRTRERAAEAFRDVLAVDSSIVEARLRLGRLLAEDGRAVEAEPLLDQALQEGSPRQRYLALLFLAREAERAADFGAAFRAYSRALEAQPDGSAARLGLALQLERQAGPAAARTAVIETLSRGARLDAAADPWSSYPFGDVEEAAATLKRLWDRAMSP
jgi:Tfp pilus assembly protein PilF